MVNSKDYLVQLIKLQNPWFENRDYLPKERLLKKRFFYSHFEKLVFDTKQISAIIGMRRVGKTVILKQILAKVLERKKELPLYFSFDQEIFASEENSLKLILDYYLKTILKTPIHKINKRVYIFLDEIQLVPYWQDILKRYYDLNQNLKFIISGSASLFLQEKSKESLAGRIFELYLPPLLFEEYLKFSQDNLPDKEIQFEDYLNFGQFFELLELKDKERKLEFLREWVLGKVLERDLPLFVKVSDLRIFRLLFNIFLQTTAQNVVLKNLAKDLEISVTSLSNYLKVLEKSFLLFPIFNLAGSFVRRERRLRKVYPSSSNFLSLLVEINQDLGKKAESYVAFVLKYFFKKEVYFFKQRGVEVDFILPEKKIAIEVKYQNRVHNDDFRNLRTVMRRKKYKKGYLFTKNFSDKRVFPEGQIICLPVFKIEELF